MRRGPTVLLVSLLAVATANAFLFPESNEKVVIGGSEKKAEQAKPEEKEQPQTQQDEQQYFDESAPVAAQDEAMEEEMAYRQAAWEAAQQEDLRRRQYLEELLMEEAQNDAAAEEQAQKEKEMMSVLAEINDGYEKMQQEMGEQEEAKKLSPRAAVPSELDMGQDEKEEEQKEEAPKQVEEVEENEEHQPTEAAPSLQKKGQSEFVSFVDPDASLRTASKLNVDKRQMDDVRTEKIRRSGGLIFLGVGTVMLVGMLGAAVGGSYYYKRRNEEPDDQEYAPYAGTGPRSKKTIKGEKGDDALAYKAQLHHYQQAKQKIICGDDAVGVGGDSEGEEEDVEDENNFSVYECPGLAPTGDIEVHNPNFAAH